MSASRRRRGSRALTAVLDRRLEVAPSRSRGGGPVRKALIALVASALVAIGAIAAIAVIGPPEIDAANATFALDAGPLKSVQCPGEDAPDQYVTTRATWKGSETDVTPGSTDYVLTGHLVYKAGVTVNQTTHRGVMEGIATLTVNPVGGGPMVKVYAG